MSFRSTCIALAPTRSPDGWTGWRPPRTLPAATAPRLHRDRGHPGSASASLILIPRPVRRVVPHNRVDFFTFFHSPRRRRPIVTFHVSLCGIPSSSLAQLSLSRTNSKYLKFLLSLLFFEKKIYIYIFVIIEILRSSSCVCASYFEKYFSSHFACATRRRNGEEARLWDESARKRASPVLESSLSVSTPSRNTLSFPRLHCELSNDSFQVPPQRCNEEFAARMSFPRIH